MSLAATLARQAAADPESPFLFWAERWNWRWWSWLHVAELSGRWSEALAGLPPGARVGFDGGAYPQAIPLALAMLAAGLTAVPLRAAAPEAAADGEAGPATGMARNELPARGCEAWLEVVAGEVRVTALDGARSGVESFPPRGTEQGSPGGTEQGRLGKSEQLRPGGAEQVRPSGAVERRPGGAGWIEAEAGGGSAGDERCRIAEADLLAAAERLAGAIGGSRGREILVLGQPLGRLSAWQLVAWAALAGAALVLEPGAELRERTVLWARPTVFHGGAGEIARLRRHAEAPVRDTPRRWIAAKLRRWRGGQTAGGHPRQHREERHPRSPVFGRLRILFQDEKPDAAQVAFWQAQGVRLLQVPGFEKAGAISGVVEGLEGVEEVQGGHGI